MRSNHDEGPRPLKLYRLYHLGEGAGVEAVSIVEAADDAEATRIAEELLQTFSGELWLQDELVSSIGK